MNRLNKIKQQTGAAVVEFAVTFFLLMLLLLGIIDFGFVWLQNNYIAQAAREGARVAAKTDATSLEVTRAIKEHLKGLYGDDVDNCCGPGAFIEIVYNPDDPSKIEASDDTEVLTRNVTVTVQTHLFWEPILWDFIDGNLPDISETAVFAREDQTDPGS